MHVVSGSIYRALSIVTRRNEPKDKAELFNAFFHAQFSERSTYDIDISFSNNSRFDVDFHHSRIRFNV